MQAQVEIAHISDVPIFNMIKMLLIKGFRDLHIRDTLMVCCFRRDQTKRNNKSNECAFSETPVGHQQRSS